MLNGGSEAVSPGDIAVLVHRHKDAAAVRDALAALGVPAVLAGARSVYLTAPARQWLSFLRALEQPHRSGLVRAAAMTSFVGWDAARLSAASDQEVDEFGYLLRGWRDLLAERGVAALLEVVTDTQNLTERLLARVGGERYLTDLRHVGQALHAAARRDDLGPAALVEWLQRQISDAEQDQTEEGSRRLESDADAVQIATIYVSKGLEFPIVYAPFGWDRNVGDDRDDPPVGYHDDQSQRVLYVGGRNGPGYESARRRHLAEDAGEALRLLYVALTRAQCQVVTWWAPTRYNTDGSALHRLLFGDRATGEQPPASVPVPDDRVVRKRLAQWAAAGTGLSVEEVAEPSKERWSPPLQPELVLDAASFSRSLDADWRRTSYSGLTAAAHDAAMNQSGVASEPEEEERRDEPPVGGVPDEASTVEASLRAVPSPMADLPLGAAFGTLVHSVLETVDTTTDDVAAALKERCAEVLPGRSFPDVTAEQLAAGLLPALQTPLGRLAFGRTLATIAPADRLTELEFELPLLGGDEPRTTTATLHSVADLLRQHLAAGDPLSAYADALADPVVGKQVLRGYLGGSVDVVLRLRDGAGTPRYLVVDYKTNWLGAFGPDGRLPLTAWDYRPATLTSAMLHAHYPLQALLYSVAVHRYLRWRQPAYDPAVHLGGVLYLFVRGMCGASTPVVDGVPTGVFSWRPPDGLVDELSKLLDQGVP
jgi:exodeoxyribonuclease V beta subunit